MVKHLAKVAHSGSTQPKCGLFGGYGLFIQFCLGVLSFSILFIKRYADRNKRSWQIWSMDNSKQVISAGITHMFNLLVSQLIEITHDMSNACTWYFITMTVDVFLGVAFSYLLFIGTRRLFSRFPSLAFTSGYYGTPPGWKCWLWQTCIWVVIVLLSKLILIGVMMIFQVELEFVGGTLLSVFYKYPEFELAFIMILLPVVLNAFVFWITDGILRHKEKELDETTGLLDAKNPPSTEYESVPTKII